MSLNRLFIVAVAGWAFAVLASFGARAVLLTSPVSAPESLAWLFLGCVPAALALMVFRTTRLARHPLGARR